MIKDAYLPERARQTNTTVTPELSPQTAAQVSLSMISWLKVYYETMDGSKESKQKRRAFLKPPNQHNLLPSYEGTQTHELMYYVALFWWLVHNPDKSASNHPSYYSPYQSKMEQLQEKMMLKQVAQLPRTADYIQQAWLAFELWRKSQNFDIQLKKGRPKQHASKNFTPERREKIWHSSTLTQTHLSTLSTVRAAMAHAQNPLKLASSLLLETPVNLYIETPAGKLMTWAQPDLVFPRVLPSNGHKEVVLLDYKLGQQLQPLEDGDHFRRLEILLSQLAAYGLATKFFHGGERSADSPPFFRVGIDEIPQMVKQTRLWNSNPQEQSEKGWFVGLDMTLSDEEVAAACVDLAMVIDFIHSAEKEELRRFLKLKRQTQKGISPSVQATANEFKHQFLLVVP